MNNWLARGLVIGTASIIGCSGTDNSGNPVASVGGSAQGGSATQGGSSAQGGSVTTGGTSTIPTTTGGNTVVANTGGKATTGGTSATTGGVSATGGAVVTGGRVSIGGGPATGGAISAGGSSAGSGGKAATGGVMAAGGNTATGGKASAGGAAPTGGTTTTGGSAPTGGASTAAGASACGTGTSTASDFVVNLSSLQQKITGFGVSSAWAGSYRNASDADYLWSTTKGAGLSLLRVRYGDGPTIAKSAASMGVTVWLTPWGMGTNGAQGGPYTTQQTNPNGCTGTMPVLSDPQGWANQLATYVTNLKNQGVQLYAVSAENEPDSCGINSTTSYSPAQIVAWLPYLSAAMKPLGVKVMAPETMNRCGFDTYFKAIKASTAAWDAVDIFASHEYGCGTLTTDASIAAAGKEYWETEVDTGKASGDSTGDGIGSALLMATTMHNDLTKPNVNAWHHWWVYNASGNGGNLYDTTTNVWTKRLWVMGNFARYVRPGFKRVSTTGTLPSGVYVSAYTNEADGTVVIVAINTGTSTANVSLFVSGAAPCKMTPYVTSASEDLAAKTAIDVSASRFAAQLAGQSVTTFVGKP